MMPSSEQPRLDAALDQLVGFAKQRARRVIEESGRSMEMVALADTPGNGLVTITGLGLFGSNVTQRATALRLNLRMLRASAYVFLSEVWMTTRADRPRGTLISELPASDRWDAVIIVAVLRCAGGSRAWCTAPR